MGVESVYFNVLCPIEWYSMKTKVGKWIPIRLAIIYVVIAKWVE